MASLSPKYRDMLKAIDYYEDPTRGLHPNRKKEFLIWSAEKMAAYDISKALPRLESIPLLVITSQHDYARPDGEKLYAEKQGPKAFHVIAKAGHFDLYDLEPYVTAAIDQIRTFFQPILGSKSATVAANQVATKTRASLPAEACELRRTLAARRARRRARFALEQRGRQACARQHRAGERCLR